MFLLHYILPFFKPKNKDSCYNPAMKKFIVINESFQCENCKYQVPKSEDSCRNHCSKCLHSKHVDKDSPGDRKSDCHGLMQPFAVSHNSKKGWMIHHKCLKCSKEMLNKTAQDDNMDLIIELSKKPIYE